MQRSSSRIPNSSQLSAPAGFVKSQSVERDVKSAHSDMMKMLRLEGQSAESQMKGSPDELSVLMTVP